VKGTDLQSLSVLHPAMSTRIKKNTFPPSAFPLLYPYTIMSQQHYHYSIISLHSHKASFKNCVWSLQDCSPLPRTCTPPPQTQPPNQVCICTS